MAESLNPNEHVVAVVRGDGFGVRLCCIANAIVAAETLGLPFKFKWADQTSADYDFHAVSPAEKVFSTAFLAEHLDQDLQPAKFQSVKEELITHSMLAAAASKSGLLVNHYVDPIQFADRPTISLKRMKRAFASIEFSKNMEAAFEAGRSAVKEPTVAVHARRGDIVYGEYRFRQFNGKYSPLATIKTAIARLKDQGVKVIVFSDDEATMTNLKDSCGVAVATDFCSLENADEVAAFDIGLMSKCERILAGRTIFTVAASMMGTVPIINVLDFARDALMLEEMLRDLEHAPSHYSQLERAKTFQWIACELDDVISLAERRSFLDQAIELDPDNMTYRHIQALDALKSGHFEVAERYLEQSALHWFETSGRVATQLAPGFSAIEKHYEKFAKNAEGHPFVGLFAASLSKRRKVDDLALSRAAYKAKASYLTTSIHLMRLVQEAQMDEAADIINGLPFEFSCPALEYAKGWYWEKAGNKHEALAHYKCAFEQQPSIEEYRVRSAYLSARCGKREVAEELLKNIEARTVKSAANLHTISLTFGRLGNVERALEFALRAASLEPDKVKYSDRLADLSAKPN